MTISLCTRLAALTWCLLMASVSHAADTQAVEDACRQEAVEDRVTAKDMDDYMDDCMSESMQDLNDEADAPTEGAARPRHRGDEIAPEGDQEPAPAD